MCVVQLVNVRSRVLLVTVTGQRCLSTHGHSSHKPVLGVTGPSFRRAELIVQHSHMEVYTSDDVNV